MPRAAAPVKWSAALRILLVEDDPMIGSAVRDHAVGDGHAVDWARSLGDAEAFRDVATFELILSTSGFLTAMATRSCAPSALPDATPVIILTARDQISDWIAGLNSGADDYLVASFDLGELSARIMPSPARPAARRAGDRDRRSPRRAGDAAGRHRGHAGRPDGARVAVLERLIERPKAIVSKEQIEEALYAFGSEVESNTVEVYVSRLRKKIGQDRVVTVRGLGYRLGPAG
jgi:two-component system OmpR family response regulator